MQDIRPADVRSPREEDVEACVDSVKNLVLFLELVDDEGRRPDISSKRKVCNLLWSECRGELWLKVRDAEKQCS